MHDIGRKRSVVRKDGSYEAFCEKLREQIKPRGMLEETLFDQAATAAWNLEQSSRWEQRILNDKKISAGDRAQALARVARYRRRNTQTYDRALRTLREERGRGIRFPLMAELERSARADRDARANPRVH